MAKAKVEGKDLNNVHKLVFLANEYKKESIREVGRLFAMTMLDINATIWRARDLGYLVIDEETGGYTVDTVPDKWQFGVEIDQLMSTIKYVFEKLAEQETDLEDEDLGKWTAGHLTHDVAVAMKRLTDERVIATYEITTSTDVPISKKAKGRGKKPKTFDSTYTFYTLWENMEQQWGRKRFPNKDKIK